MTSQDVEALANVIEQALEAQRQMLEARIEQRAQACVSAERAVELARDAVGEAEDRLREILQQRTSEAVTAMRHAASEELARMQDLLMRRLMAADALSESLEHLQDQLSELSPKDGASAYELAVADGFDGSQSDWLVSLRGASGHNGTAPSAAEVAVELKADAAFRQALRGADGSGITAPQWAPGIWRADTIVQVYFGQYYRAVRDTSAAPYGSDDWQRIGTTGFHLAEPWNEGRTYQPGDLFVRDFGLFTWTDEGAQLLVGRGRPGDPGPKGEKGRDGRNGKDGASFELLELQGTMLALVMRQADGQLDSYPVDLSNVFGVLGEAIEERIFARLVNRFGGTP